MTNITAIADNAGKENLSLVVWLVDIWILPMLKFVEKMGGMIHCRQHFKHGNIFPFREEKFQETSIPPLPCLGVLTLKLPSARIVR